jgi:glucose-1-phosphate cytidylyltransferase
MIKEYFANYYLHTSDVTFDMSKNSLEVHQNNAEPWRVTLINTGDETMTGGRLKRVGNYLKDDEAFCFTYGDGVCDVNIAELLAFHRTHGKLATVTAVQPAGRYGALDIEENQVRGFIEKPQGDGGGINGGFFVLSPKVLELIDSDETYWEQEPLTHLAIADELKAYKHNGFWQPMDTIREKNILNELWDSGRAPWKVW